MSVKILTIALIGALAALPVSATQYLGIQAAVAAPQAAAIPASRPPAASPPSVAAAEPAFASPNDFTRDPARRNSQISTARTRPQATTPASTPAAPAEPRQRGNGISVKPGGELPKPKPELTNAYESLRMGRVEDARRQYDALLLSEPRNIDALLGRATIAQQQGDLDAATRYFYQVLQLDPANTLAQGGLINLIGRADPQSAESRLKALVAKDPSAFLYFALGNLYADQGNWPAAQSAYFQAHHLQSDNADYLFNLAVSLEHLSQPRLALGFYRQALDLARSSGRSSFDFAAAQERVAKLAATVD